MSMIVNEEGLKRGRENYGPQKNIMPNITASCKWCYCTKDMHQGGGSGKCKFCDQCQGFDTGGVTKSKPESPSLHGPQ